MDVKSMICSQYGAALDMLEQAVKKCPDELWDDPQDKNRFWHVAFHTLFYAHLYLQPEKDDFRPWPKHRPHTSSLAPEEAPVEPYTREEILEYLGFCRKEVNRQIGQLDPEAPSGFYWLAFNKLELQFYSIRHIQQHTGELMERLGARYNIDVDWVDTKKM